MPVIREHRFNSYYVVPKGHELGVRFLVADEDSRMVVGLEVHCEAKAEAPVGAELALDRIIDHVAASATAVLELTAFGWSHVANALEWGARRVKQ